MNLVSRIASDLRLMMRRPERLQFGALCYRWTKKPKELEILLITSRDTGRWVIPKGWPMGGRMAYAVAEREAFEEAGVKGKAEQTSVGYYFYLKKLDSGLKVPVKVQVHALEVKEMVKDFKEKGMRQAEWCAPQEAARRVAEDDLKELILSLEASLNAIPSKRAVKS